MTKPFKHTLAVLAFAATALTLASCKDDDSASDFNDEDAAAIAEQFVDHTVAPTYTALAAQAEALVDRLVDLRANPTDAAVRSACETFLEARAEWERSEAFLFGAAGAFGIDPHIDSWPLDLTAFNNLMASPKMIDSLDAEDGDEVAYNTLGNAILGFHGLEYILFADGQPKAASSITSDELVYAIAVAGDLRNNCYRLEVSWVGDDAPASHIKKLEALEWAYTIDGSGYSYGQNMKRAGNPGSTYSSRTRALMDIVQGCIDIADEVGSSKINSAYAMNDETYIESPYSHRSITDFHNNIVSIQNVYMGGVEGQRNEARSLHNMVRAFDSSLDAKVLAAISNALAKIDAMPAPFVNNIHAPANGEAVDACNALSSTLGELVEAIRKK